MRNFRLFLLFLCLVCLGVALGQIFILHQGTWLLHWFVGFLTILAVSFLPVRRRVFAGIRYVVVRTMRLLIGGYGYGIMFLTHAALILIMLQSPLVEKIKPGEVTDLAGIYAVFLILGVTLFGERLFRKKK